MELLKAESSQKEERHLKLLAKYKKLTNQAINSSQESETEDSKLLHVKIN